MFERFTAYARHTVVLSQEEARRMNHNYIGTEHILLGLLGEPAGVAYRVLEAHGMTLKGVREEIAELIGPGKQAQRGGHIPFTPRAKKTLELALREALQLKHNYIGTEHILLGLMREGDGVAAQIMRKHADLMETPDVGARRGAGRESRRRRRVGGRGNQQRAPLAAPAADGV